MAFPLKSLMILALSTGMVVGCKDIVVKVGKKEKKADIVQNSSAEDGDLQPNIQPRDMEYYLYNLDNLRDTPADKLIQRLEKNWRLIFRREFRALRDGILAAAERQHSYQDGIYFNVGTECSELRKADLGQFDSIEFLPNLLEGSFLAYLTSEDSKKLNPDLEPALDISAHLILFELGMQGKGWSEVEVKDEVTYSKSRILWKVDSEIQDPPEELAKDDVSVGFDFIRGLKNGKPKNFSLVVHVGRGVFEGTPEGPQYRMEVTSEWKYPDQT